MSKSATDQLDPKQMHKAMAESGDENLSIEQVKSVFKAAEKKRMTFPEYVAFILSMQQR
jgi:hypothetical protein